MTNCLRVIVVGAIAIPLTWWTLSMITMGAPPQSHSYQTRNAQTHSHQAWDELVAYEYQPGSGFDGPGRRGDDRRPPPPRDDRRPPRGGPGGGRGDGPPPPRREGPPPHPGSGGRSHLEHLRQVDPEMAELVEQDQQLEQETYELVETFQRAPEKEKQEIRSSLEHVVNEHFEVRQNRRQLELKRLEAELERLRATLETRTEAREEIVKRRVAEVLGNDPLQF